MVSTSLAGGVSLDSPIEGLPRSALSGVLGQFYMLKWKAGCVNGGRVRYESGGMGERKRGGSKSASLLRSTNSCRFPTLRARGRSEFSTPQDGKIRATATCCTAPCLGRCALLTLSTNVGTIGGSSLSSISGSKARRRIGRKGNRSSSCTVIHTRGAHSPLPGMEFE